MNEQPIKVLIVDDNAPYREAFKRTLRLERYAVCEAADADAALAAMQSEAPDVVVTDLQMRTPREGIELIEALKSVDPLTPVILISAVGTFEEGALATKLGAAHVMHKSRIEQEMAGFFDTVRRAHRACQENRRRLALIRSARQQRDRRDQAGQVEAVLQLLGEPDVDPYVKGEAYDFITSFGEDELRCASETDLQQAAASGPHAERCAAVEKALKAALPAYDAMREDARKALSTAEYLYALCEAPGMPDFARAVAFSYCYAVECQVREKLKGKTTHLAADAANQQVFEACVDSRSRRVDPAFQHSLMQALRGTGIHFTMDNVAHLVVGMQQRRERFMVDGLKDTGILLACFGRAYSFSRWGREVAVENPLRVRGLAGEREVLDLTGRLITLQYLRNPYVHPGIQKKEHLSVVRETAIECLNVLSRVV